MQVIMSVLLQLYTVFLPVVGSAQPPTPVVVEAVASLDAAACFEELPASLVASGVQAVCPIPGLSYPVLSGNDQIALVGNRGDGRRVAWGGANTYSVVNTSQTVADADIIEVGESVTGMYNQPSVAAVPGPYILLAFGSPASADTSAAGVEQRPPLDELADFTSWLKDLINDTESMAIILQRGGLWHDETGKLTTSAVALGCGSGATIEWVATGPFRMVAIGTASVRILFKGVFNQPSDQTCMRPYVWVEVARLYTIPEVKRRVDNYRDVGTAPTWNWDVGGGLEYAFTWTGWDYLSFFAVRAVPNPANALGLYFVIPTDFMRLDCVFLDGDKVCTIEQQPEF